MLNVEGKYAQIQITEAGSSSLDAHNGLKAGLAQTTFNVLVMNKPIIRLKSWMTGRKKQNRF